MFKCVEALCIQDGTKGTIVLESDNPDFAMAIEELRSTDARNFAIRKAASIGLPDPRINGNVVTYPIDATGTPIETPSAEVARYRGDIPVVRDLV